MRISAMLALLLVWHSWTALRAAEIVRVLPPPGIEISAADRKSLEAELSELDAACRAAESNPPAKANSQATLNDVAVYAKAVRFALLNGEFYVAKDVAKAKALLKSADARLTAFRAGKPAWTSTPGPHVAAYRSAIDDSLQPYGLELPADFDPSKPYHLVVWLRGRSDQGTDMHFIAEREAKSGQFRFPNAIILHPFGRHCNAYKFAGEVDVFEAIADVRKRYKIEGKPALMGFSMGGAGCWHLAAHYPDFWQCAAPGAGFVDVRRYQNLSGDKLPAWYVQELWNWYDVPPYTKQLAKLPLLAYSGELDKQKASADIMEQEYAAIGAKLPRIIGQGMEHKYDKSSIEAITKWVVGEMQKPSTPIGYQGPHYKSSKPGDPAHGPIDAAFMSKFVFVAPTGKSDDAKVTAWVEQEMAHQLRRWRELFRGEIRVVKDVELTKDDYLNANLVLWGDAQSNSIIRDHGGKLPIAWTKGSLKVGDKSYPAGHVLVAVYPKMKLFWNQQPGVVVLNSGPTFREGHDKTNSQQTPKLPDWAVIDVTTPPSDTAPGKIVTAGFFDKDWKFVDPDQQQAEWKSRQAK